MTRLRYRSGCPRVHAATPEHEIRAAIEEYEAFEEDPGLVPFLRECAEDLREELAMRAAESARGAR